MLGILPDTTFTTIGSIVITVILPVFIAWIALVPQLKKLRTETQLAAKTESDRRDLERTRIDTEQRLANVREHQELYGVLNGELKSLRERIQTLETELSKSRTDLLTAMMSSASAERDAAEAKRATQDCKQNEQRLIGEMNALRDEVHSKRANQ